MSDHVNLPLIISGVDVTHTRLVDLAKLADQAEPFYLWVEEQFQIVLDSKASLNTILLHISESEIRRAMQYCYNSSNKSNLPLLFDGIGRSYTHSKACYYFFSWLIRDAPQQRLGPLIQRIIRSTKQTRPDIEIQVLAALIYKYRSSVKNFSWPAVREVIIDRLEGSRRSIKGHEKETVVRTALIAAIQEYYADHLNYGIYSKVEIPDGQITIGKETFDISANLLDHNNKRISRILIPIKTRETEGGGHAHLFTRDITSAINAARFDNQNDFIIAIIVAKNWHEREAQSIREIVDYTIVFDISPNDFTTFSYEEQKALNSFISEIFSGSIKRKNIE